MISKAHWILGLMAGATVMTVLGCSSAVNPFVDDTASAEPATTASEEKVRAAQATPVVRRRDWEQSRLGYASGDVEHWPLWFEDPFEDKGSEDGKYALTAEDYIAMPYSFARLLLNTMGWPVSAVVTPPPTPMVSDGRLSQQALGKDHDAIPLKRRHDESPMDIDEGDSEEPADLAVGPAAPVDDDSPEGPPYIEHAGHEEPAAH